MWQWIQRILKGVGIVIAVIGLGSLGKDFASWQEWVRQLSSVFGLQGILILIGATLFILSTLPREFWREIGRRVKPAIRVLLRIPTAYFRGASRQSREQYLTGRDERLIAIGALKRSQIVATNGEILTLANILMAISQRLALGADTNLLVVVLIREFGRDWQWQGKIANILAELRLANVINPAESRNHYRLTDFGARVIQMLRQE